MRQFSACLGITLAALVANGCAPQALVSDDGYEGDALNTVLNAASDPGDLAEDPADSSVPSLSNDAPLPTKTARTFSGSVTGSDEYRLFELGSGLPGDEWTITPTGLFSAPFVVVLLDADENLLMRTYMYHGNPLRHVLRQATEQVYLGIMPPKAGTGGDFDLEAALEAGKSLPKPAPQVVWLNFEGGGNVRVHRNGPISFPTFDGAMLGEEYAGHTQKIKDVIVEEMRADYAPYDVVILSSDDGPPPPGAYSTVHFGGGESGLLGLADNVDNYNQDPVQGAIIYVENFAPYWTMQLEPDEMAVMVANVASHELGHLLGLYHTRDPDDLMDTTGSAWELAENQSFVRSPLESSVFATGWEDSPRLLEHIVGSSPESAKSAVWAKPAKAAVYKAIRRFAQDEVDFRCGTCLSLSHE